MGAGVGAVSLTGIAGSAARDHESSTKSGEKIKLLSPDGNLVEVDKDDIKPAKEIVAELKEEARKGLAKQKICYGNRPGKMQKCQKMC